VESGDKGGNILLSRTAVLFDLVDGAIQGVDGLPRLLLSLRNGDSVAGRVRGSSKVFSHIGHLVSLSTVLKEKGKKIKEIEQGKV